MVDSTEVLSEEALGRFRGGWVEGDGNALMLGSADESLTGAYEPSSPFVTWVSDRFYREGMFSGKERERVLISVLSDGPDLTLAIHVYWGLMEGLSVQEVCEVILMTAAYRGIPLYSNKIRVVQRVLALLRDLDDQGSSAPGIAVRSIIQAYS